MNEVYFEYRKKGTDSWSETDKYEVIESQEFECFITGLEPSTVYEYRAILETDGVVESIGDIVEFTTLFLPTPGVYTIAKPISFVSTKEINGAWYADMRISPDQLIEPESYIEKDGELYIVKNIKKIKSDTTYYDVKLYHNMIELSEITIDVFSELQTPAYFLNKILNGTEWTTGLCDIDEKVHLKIDKRISRLEALNMLAEKCGGELYWHSLGRVVDLKREIGEPTGLQLRYDKNSTYIEKEEDTHDLITRIYPYGPDNYEINMTQIDTCEDETLYSASGSGYTDISYEKMQGSQAIKLISNTLNETFTRDLGAGNVVNLSGHTLVKFWIYSETANTNGFQFGIGESVWNEITANTGALEAECWKEVTRDISGIADASKDAIRYIGFKNLSSSATVSVDNIRAFSGDIYLDSPNIDKYKIIKDYVYIHSAKPEKQKFEVIINTTADTFVNEESKTRNYGTEWRFKVRDDTGRKLISYVKFPLLNIPIGATIEEAKLFLHITSTDFKSGANVEIQYAASDWNEKTVTWNNRPASAGNITTLNGNSTGWKEIEFKSAVENWWSGTKPNYGIRLELNITDVDKSVNINSKESNFKPYIKVTYTIVSDPSDIIKTGAWNYMVVEGRDEPKLKYKFNIIDLSKVQENTWEEETIDIGDTVRAYDGELGINTTVRVVKIVKDHLNPANTQIELANKAYNLADLEAKREKQLSYAMPFKNNPNIIDAGAIQAGYLGGDVQL